MCIRDRALAATSAAAGQGQQVTESILLQGQPVIAEPQTVATGAARSSPAEVTVAATPQAGPRVVLQPGVLAPTGARSQLGPGELAPRDPRVAAGNQPPEE
eukprot:7937351-Alexandrium_andersonii.AAC.1